MTAFAMTVSAAAWLSMLDESSLLFAFFFFNDTAPTEIYILPLHDALPISAAVIRGCHAACRGCTRQAARSARTRPSPRSEEHTSELQSRFGISYAFFF